MSLITGSVREVGDARPMDVVLLNSAGQPVFGFDPSRPSTATQTQLTFTAAAQAIAAANAARRQLIVVNNTNKTLFLSFAGAATLSNYAIPVASGATYIGDLNGYTGDVSGILASAPSSSNKVNVTEVTA